MNKLEYIGKCLLVNEKEKKILVVGDLHLGFEESLNESGIFIGRKMFGEMIGDFDKVFDAVGERIDEIVLLGDVKHEFGRVLRQEWNDVLGLFDYLKGKCERIVLVKGNHDKIIEPIARERKIEVVDYYVVGKYCFLHGDRDFDEIWDNRIKAFVVGHVHPAVNLKDGVKVEKYKCFLVGKFKRKEIIAVPSFIEYYEGSDPREKKNRLVWGVNLEKFDVKIVGEKDLGVLDFGKMDRLS